MDFFNQGIPLGRWFRIQVILHWTFLLYAANEILRTGEVETSYRLAYVALLFGTVLLHEFGHALSCRAVGGEAHQIVLWPLGGIAFVQPPMNPVAWLVTTACGPLVNAILWPLFYVISQMAVTHSYGDHAWHTVLNEFARDDRMIVFADVSFPIQMCIDLWRINRLLLLFNLIPAYPMDGGRLLQEILWFMVGYPRSLRIAGMVGTVAGGGLIVLGLGTAPIDIPAIGFKLGQEPSLLMIIIGLLAAIQSFAIYKRSAEIQSWRKR
jgi:Zn-dependent protease